MTCADLIAEARHHGADVVLDGSGRPVVRCARPLPDDLMARLRDHRDEMVRWLRIEVELGPDLAGMVAEVVEARDELARLHLLPPGLHAGEGLLDLVGRRLRLRGLAAAVEFAQALYAADVAGDDAELRRIEGAA